MLTFATLRWELSLPHSPEFCGKLQHAHLRTSTRIKSIAPDKVRPSSWKTFLDRRDAARPAEIIPTFAKVDLASMADSSSAPVARAFRYGYFPFLRNVSTFIKRAFGFPVTSCRKFRTAAKANPILTNPCSLSGKERCLGFKPPRVPRPIGGFRFAEAVSGLIGTIFLEHRLD